MENMNEALEIMWRGLLVVFVVMTLFAGVTWLSGRVFISLDKKEKERVKAAKEAKKAAKEAKAKTAEEAKQAAASASSTADQAATTGTEAVRNNGGA